MKPKVQTFSFKYTYETKGRVFTGWVVSTGDVLQVTNEDDALTVVSNDSGFIAIRSQAGGGVEMFTHKFSYSTNDFDFRRKKAFQLALDELGMDTKSMMKVIRKTSFYKSHVSWG